MGIEDQLFQLRFTAKQLEKQASKSLKQSEAEKLKVKKALENKDRETAQLYAENAIRKKNEYLNLLRLSSRVDAVSSRVKSAMMMQSVAKNIGSVTKSLESAMASMDLEKVSKIMEAFEKQFEDLDVRSGVMENAMSSASTLTTPLDQVTSLIKEVAAENNLDVSDQVINAPNAASTTIGSGATASAARSIRDEDDLTNRLAALRN